MREFTEMQKALNRPPSARTAALQDTCRVWQSASAPPVPIERWEEECKVWLDDSGQASFD
jgi:hypothetical protein